MSTKLQKHPLFGSLGDSENGSGFLGDDEGIELENVQKRRNQEGDETFIGLSCDEAYSRLCGIIRHELIVFNQANNVGLWCDFVAMLTNSSTSFNWISLCLVLLQILLLILGYAFQDSRRALPMVELSIIVTITALNIVLGLREERLKKTELSKKIGKLLARCQSYRLSCPWSEASYPHLATPSTDSLSLVWTYRKNRLVNVPANLLVQGDVIVLGPGQKCPAKVQLKTPNSEKIFDAGEMYHPENEEQQAAHLENEILFSRQPCPRQKFTVVEAPLEEKLRNTFYSSQRRPPSLLDNERRYIIRQVLQFRVIPIILGLSFLINLMRFLLSRDEFGSWSEMVFILQAYVFLPLLPLIFPLMWIVINCFGTARIQVLFKTEISQLSKKDSSLLLSDVNYHFWEIFKGESDTLSRTANLLHTLGTISVLCCVNKDGILASPNPNAEKVFFFRKRKERRNKRVAIKDPHFGSDDDKAVFFTANIDDDEESSTSPTVRTDVHFRAIQGEEESEHSAMPTPLLHHKGWGTPCPHVGLGSTTVDKREFV